jgi:NADH dehydrogenase
MNVPEIRGKRGSLDVVTGAFSFTGRYIAGRLLARGREVRTLTGHPERPHPLRDRITVAPFSFDEPAALVANLRGAEVLYNTYWIRFPRGGATFQQALAHTELLVRAAEEAGVARIVHISITNPADDSPLPYFRTKALAEHVVIGSSLSHALIRPTVVFGDGDVLVNNIAWLVRRFGVFAVPAARDARIRPVHVDDVARLAVEMGGRHEDVVVDAVGPETFAFEELVQLVAETLGRRVRCVELPPRIVVGLASAIGVLTRDVVLTTDELRGLMAGLVATAGPATGSTKLSDWLRDHHEALGTSYASELQRHYR